MADDDVRKTIETGLRAAVAGDMGAWTVGQRRAILEAASTATEHDIVRAVEKILDAGLRQVVAEKRKPSARREAERARRREEGE